MIRTLLAIFCFWWLCDSAFAARVVVEKATGKLIEYQSDASPGTLTANAVSAGYAADAVVEREVTDPEWTVLRRQWIEVPDAQAQEVKATATHTALLVVLNKLGLTEADFAILQDALR